MTQMYDVQFGHDGIDIVPHFCREYDCFGTNPDHGMTLDEACEYVAQWYDEQARLYRTKEHHIVRYYEND